MKNETLGVLEAIKQKGVDVCLVSKYWNDKQIMDFYNLGYRKFGENRVDILEKRYKNLPKDIEWHFLGNIQSRDLPKICKFSSLIQSFDRPDLLEKISNYQGVNILIQINLFEDKNRNGIALENLDNVIDKINHNQVTCKGFMIHPPQELTDDEKKLCFEKMSEVFLRHPNFSILSMGTSGDYELANNSGATLNRLGRVLTN
ncbi:MAG: hypothetical protein CMB56_005200 [Methanobacteriota archaeon]|nr:MAG: hypothetical protein CMB56_005200 [Euryarchaeota archaeon]|tara:strand:- start:39 stop:644 length:606 start_codon:yes stop_codon:yes gene_type:complete